MKVLHVIHSLETGGAEKLVTESLPIMERNGCQVDLALLKYIKTPFQQQLEANFGGKIFGLTTGSVYSPILIFKLIPLLKRYDLIHVHLFPAVYWVVFAKLLSFSKVRIIYTEHNTTNKRRNIPVLSNLDRLVYAKLDFIGCISQGAKDNLLIHMRYKEENERISVIFNGINLSAFKQSPSTSVIPQVTNDRFVLIQISSFREQKDQATLIKALSHLPAPIQLLLVGDGHLRARHEDLVKDLSLTDRVTFMGIRSDIPELLHASDVCVLSSHHEGFGLAIVEGMAAGIPCIGSDVSGLSEIVNGYGLLFEKENVDELVTQILSLYHDEVYYKKVAERCLQRASHFDIRKMVAEYIQVYKNTLSVKD